MRDVTFDEDRSRIRVGNGPAMMACLRSLVIAFARLRGFTNFEPCSWPIGDRTHGDQEMTHGDRRHTMRITLPVAIGTDLVLNTAVARQAQVDPADVDNVLDCPPTLLRTFDGQTLDAVLVESVAMQTVDAVMRGHVAQWLCGDELDGPTGDGVTSGTGTVQVP